MTFKDQVSDFSSHLRLLFCLQNSREGTVLGRIWWRGEQCPVTFYILLLPRQDYKCIFGTSGEEMENFSFHSNIGKKFVWTVILSPVNTSASIIICDFCNTVDTFCYSALSLLLMPLLNWFLSSPSANSYYSRIAQVWLLKLSHSGLQHHIKIWFV